MGNFDKHLNGHVYADLKSELGACNLLPPASRTPFRRPPQHPKKHRKEYLKQSSSTAGRRSENIVRTVPVPWCQSGGSDTYRRHPSRKELHDAMNSEHAKAKREFARWAGCWRKGGVLGRLGSARETGEGRAI